ncbi:MAG: NAD+ synthase [Planctomycetales bacterium]|nr:NAD+ synthase [Planctomycetales bacterium]
MKIALAQLNPTVGDLAGNVALVRDAVGRARQAGAELVVTSELIVSGYPPKDLLLREGFVAACDREVVRLAQSLPPEIGVLIGHPTAMDMPPGRIANAASLLFGGAVVGAAKKCLLPNYDVFDERRYFLPADRAEPISFCDRRLGVHICEDAWWGEPGTPHHLEPTPRPDPVAQLGEAGADVLINLSASPFEIDKPHRRERLAERHAARHQLPFVFVNQVGGNDDLVFDGNSFLLDATGQPVLQLAPFADDLQMCEIAGRAGESGATPATMTQRSRAADLLDALTLGLRDYARKSGFRECVLGLSGGIDSALACYIAARAFGAKQVHALAMPSRYSSDHSVADAKQLAESLGVDFEIIPIDDIHRAYESTRIVEHDLATQPGGLADQNLQARIRGALVMIRSNRNGWLALATGNKSELAVGYCTLYGDMAGGFAVLCDVFKRDVYLMARHINNAVERREMIPAGTLSKAPSAELAPNQFDQDTLPPYDLLDAILEGLIEREASVEKLSREFPAETVRWVASRLDRNEFKRRQMPPGIKLSQRAFGSGRRMPMAAKFTFEE